MSLNTDVAQHSMDLFYQQYKTNADFWTVEDFDYFVGVAFGKIVADEYARQRAQMRADREDGYVIFSREWAMEAEVDVDTKAGYSIELPAQVMTFPFDPWCSGVLAIFPIGCGKSEEFIRTSGDTRWNLKHVPNSDNTFWYLERGKRVNLFNNEACEVKTVGILYIPSTTSGVYEIPNTLEADVIALSWNIMIAGKEKRPMIKDVNDSNKTPAPEVESNIKRP